MGAFADALNRPYSSLTEALTTPIPTERKVPMMPPVNWSQVKMWAGHQFAPPNHDKVYAVWIENRGGPTPFTVMSGYDKRDTTKKLRMQHQGDFDSLSAAERKMELVIREKKHYTDISTSAYKSGISLPNRWSREQALERIDSSRLVGYTATSAPGVYVRDTATATPKKQEPVEIKGGRVDRSLDF